MENRKRGRETSDQKKSNSNNNNTKKRGIMSMEEEEEDFDVEISYKLENAKNFTRTEEYHREDDESGAGAGAGAGVFDFPWLKGSEEVNFRAEIDECLDSTFAASTSSYDYDDREIREIATTTTTTSNSGGDNTGLFDKKTLRVHELDIDLDLNLDLDLIDQFFMDNLSNTGTAQSSHHDDNDQLKMKNIEDEQLKIDDQKLVEPKEGT